MTHTQGRLDYDIDSTIIYSGNTEVAKMFNPQMSNDGWRTAVSNARRLVAAWNACEGIPTGMLENLADDGATIAPIYRDLLVQRDELLEALKDLERVAGTGMPSDDPARVAARAAIAKVEGSA